MTINHDVWVTGDVVRLNNRPKLSLSEPLQKESKLYICKQLL